MDRRDAQPQPWPRLGRGLGMGYRSAYADEGTSRTRPGGDRRCRASGHADSHDAQAREEAAAEANRVAAAVAKPRRTKSVKITVKGAKQAANDAENVANKLRRIQNKDARSRRRGARQAAADAVNVASKLRALPRAKDTKVSAPQAVAAKSQVDGLRNSIAALQSRRSTSVPGTSPWPPRQERRRPPAGTSPAGRTHRQRSRRGCPTAST